jgi:UDP-glucose 4-epimerase
MRSVGAQRILFSSTGSIYGEPNVFPTPETCPFPTQTSVYGASKLASEGLIGAYCHGQGFSGVVCRFVSVLGERYTHGHVFDFYGSLLRDPSRLRVLGNGKQRKSYLYVEDCVAGMLTALDAGHEGEVATFNLGRDETVIVDESIKVITEHMGITPEREYTGGERGWPGDSPLIHLDCARLQARGWVPEVSIRDALGRTLEWFDENQWVFADGIAGSG